MLHVSHLCLLIEEATFNLFDFGINNGSILIFDKHELYSNFKFYFSAFQIYTYPELNFILILIININARFSKLFCVWKNSDYTLVLGKKYI
jgi:hypothetical protein